jgi:hypothetical protein
MCLSKSLIVLYNRKIQKNLGSTNIKRYLIKFGLDVPKPTIEAWIYRKTRTGGV